MFESWVGSVDALQQHRERSIFITDFKNKNRTMPLSIVL
jgi:hypothetical protein